MPMPGCPELALFADAAAGADDSLRRGLPMKSWSGCSGRLEPAGSPHVAARKLAMVAELIR